MRKMIAVVLSVAALTIVPAKAGVIKDLFLKAYEIGYDTADESKCKSVRDLVYMKLLEKGFTNSTNVKKFSEYIYTGGTIGVEDRVYFGEPKRYEDVVKIVTEAEKELESNKNK